LAAVIRYTVDRNLGIWAGRPPEYLCIGGGVGSSDALKPLLEDLQRYIVPASECRFHTSAEPPLAPLVRHLPTLRPAVILRVEALFAPSPQEREIRIEWEAGYDYDGVLLCSAVHMDGAWRAHGCEAIERQHAAARPGH
jgi:hypothetical protein